MWRTALIALVMLTVMTAGVLKLLDAAAFRDSLRSWDLIPHALRTPASMFVPAVEVAIGAVWLIGYRARWVVLAASALVALFTLVYVVHWAALRVPQCDCFGRWLAFERDRVASIGIIGRNSVLLGMLIVGLWPRHKSPSSAAIPGSCWQGRVPARNGFTIVELLVVIAIVTILVAQLSPVLSSIRLQARRGEGLARQRQHAAAFIAYTADAKDTWPAFTVPSATFTVLRGDGAIVYAEYFDAMWTWPIPLAPSFYNTSWRDTVFAYNTGSPYPTPYWYSGAFLASPEFWNPVTRIGPVQWRATRAAEVLFSSHKALVVRVGTTIRDEPADGRVWFAFTDGSAAELAQNQYAAGYPGGASGYPGAMALENPFPGLATVDGVRGRDR